MLARGSVCGLCHGTGLDPADALMKCPQCKGRKVAPEALAEAIVKLSSAAESLRRSGLNEEGLIVLLSDSTRLSKSICRLALKGLSDLRKDYCSERNKVQV